MTGAGKGIRSRFEFRTSGRRAGVQAAHFAHVRRQDARTGRQLQTVFG